MSLELKNYILFITHPTTKKPLFGIKETENSFDVELQPDVTIPEAAQAFFDWLSSIKRTVEQLPENHRIAPGTIL